MSTKMYRSLIDLSSPKCQSWRWLSTESIPFRNSQHVSSTLPNPNLRKIPPLHRKITTISNGPKSGCATVSLSLSLSLSFSLSLSNKVLTCWQHWRFRTHCRSLLLNETWNKSLSEISRFRGRHLQWLRIFFCSLQNWKSSNDVILKTMTILVCN